MAKTGKTLIEFNVKNGKFATTSDSGSTWTVAPLTYLTKFAKEKNLSTSQVYGDGEEILNLVNDKGFTGTIGMTAEDHEYNKAIGIEESLNGGTGEVQQKAVIEHCIYFEVDYVDADKKYKTKKCWVFGVEAQAPSMEYDQNTDNINQSTVEYALTIKGVNVKASSGTTDYVDANGQTKKCFILSALPTDTGYATFGDSVPTPKMSV